MKKISITIMMVVLGFIFMGAVNAKEVDLSSVATIYATVGGPEKEIVQITTSTYKYYFKYVKIADDEFNNYLAAKYIVDNTNDSTSEHATASTKMADIEKN